MMIDKIKEFHEKAMAGDAVAQYNMGQAYMMGMMGAPNHEEAASWWRKAAEQGLAAAQFNLALVYLNHDTGMSSEGNLLSATNWLKMAAKQGHEQAQSVLDGLEKEIEKSLRKG